MAVTSASHTHILIFNRSRIKSVSHTKGLFAYWYAWTPELKSYPCHPSPIAHPPYSPLFVPVLKHELKTCLAVKLFKHLTMIDGHLRFAHSCNPCFILYTSVCIFSCGHLWFCWTGASGQLIDWEYLLPWMLGEKADLPSFVPVEYIVVCLFYFSRSSRQAPHVLVHHLLSLTLQKPGLDAAQFCYCLHKQTDANKQEATVCEDSPLGHRGCFSFTLPSSWLPQSAWLSRRKGKELLCTSRPYVTFPIVFEYEGPICWEYKGKFPHVLMKQSNIG